MSQRSGSTKRQAATGQSNDSLKYKKHKRAVLLVEAQFKAQLQLHAEAQSRTVELQEKEKLLCDQVVHQRFFAELYIREGCPVQTEPTTQQQQLISGYQLLAAGEQQQQQQQQGPCSYIARLLRRDVRREVQRVLQMTAQDWLDFFANLVPRLVLLLELCHRADHLGRLLQETGPAGNAAPPSAHASTCPPPACNLPSTAQHSHAAAPLVDGASQQAQPGSSAVAHPADSSSGTVLSDWFGQHPPLGQFPTDYQQLQEIADSMVTTCMLAYVFNHVPLLQACASSYSPGPKVQPTQQHWEMVADKLHLTELQELHMCICLAEYRRATGVTRADGAEAAMTAATPSLLVAAATQQQQRQAQQQGQGQGPGQGQSGLPGSNPTMGGGHALAGKSRSAAAAAADPATSYAPRGQSAAAQGLPAQQHEPEAADLALDGTKGQDYLQARLRQYVDKRHMHLLSACMQFINTLSPYQNALIVSLSYPWMPSFTAVAEVLTQRRALRLSQQVAAVQSVQVSSRSCSPPAAAGSPVAAATANSDSPAVRVACGRLEQQSSFLQGMIQQHQERRMQELQAHWELCWSELNATIGQQMLLSAL